jgi:hypothetical protein
MLSSPFQIACDQKKVRTMTVANASPNVGFFCYHYWQIGKYLDRGKDWDCEGCHLWKSEDRRRGPLNLILT